MSLGTTLHQLSCLLFRLELRVVLLMGLAVCMNAAVLLEQPNNSVLEFYPRVRDWMRMMQVCAQSPCVSRKGLAKRRSAVDKAIDSESQHVVGRSSANRSKPKPHERAPISQKHSEHTKKEFMQRYVFPAQGAQGVLVDGPLRGDYAQKTPCPEQQRDNSQAGPWSFERLDQQGA